MAIRNIVKIGDDILSKKAKEIKDITPNIISILDDMQETLDVACGCGLAAQQVGILKKMFIVNIKEDEENNEPAFFLEIINPEILEKSGETFEFEGCLSVPGQTGKVKRAKKIKLKGLNRNGEEIIIEAENFPARAIQHEFDHLNGEIYIDKATEIKYNE